MKILLLLVVGFASVLSTKGVDHGSHMPVHLTKLSRLERDIKTELVNSLRDTLNQIIDKIKDAVKQGKEVAATLLEKANLILDHLKDMGADAGDKAKELMREIRDKVKDRLRDLLEKLFLSIRSPRLGTFDPLDRVDIKVIFLKIMEMISDKVDLEKVVGFIQDNFGEFKELSEQLVQAIRTLGEKGLRDLLNRILGEDGEPLTMKAIINPLEIFENIKEFFKGLDLSQIGLKAIWDFKNFFQWVVDTVKKGFDMSLPAIEKLKNLAEVLIREMEHVGKDVAREALGFFGLYKKDIGDLFKQMEDKFNMLFG